ncbi:MAG: hypothetical protein JW996_01435, partial [Candidatus Cloacimonetes bacterium]|nr:hypothetical protein [Candidatus Cloacimonadota bacterium]
MKIIILTLMLVTFTITLPAEIPDWEVITGTSYSMVLMAKIYLNEENFTGTGDNLAGAFGPGGETDCRSLAAWQPDNPPHYEGFWYFTIVGNLESEEISFKIYAAAFDSVFSCNQSIEFHNDTTLGTPTDP